MPAMRGPLLGASMFLWTGLRDVLDRSLRLHGVFGWTWYFEWTGDSEGGRVMGKPKTDECAYDAEDKAIESKEVSSSQDDEHEHS